MSQFFTFTCSKFSAPDCHNKPGSGKRGWFQTVVAATLCSVTGRNIVSAGAAGSVMVVAVGGALQTPAGDALRIVPC